MDLCNLLLDDFKKNTVQELKKKGYSVTDSEGNVVKNIHEVLGDFHKVKKRTGTPPDKRFQCNARIWNNGYGARCTKIKNAESDYCSQHSNHLKRHDRLIYGKWKGTRHLRYPDNFGRRSNTVIKWKGDDVSYETPQSKKSSKVRRSSSIKKSSAAKKIQARQRGRRVRKKTRKN